MPVANMNGGIKAGPVGAKQAAVVVGDRPAQDEEGANHRGDARQADRGREQASDGRGEGRQQLRLGADQREPDPGGTRADEDEDEHDVEKAQARGVFEAKAHLLDDGGGRGRSVHGVGERVEVRNGNGHACCRSTRLRRPQEPPCTKP